MRLPLYQVDAFADAPFEGNPAAVVPLDRWLDDAQLQRIARENNLPETAFFVAEDDGFRLRWFTPTTEVPLCGHATLASTHVLYTRLGWAKDAIVFQTKSGPLTVRPAGEGRYTLDFPARRGEAWAAPDALAEALGDAPDLVVRSATLVAVFRSEAQVRALRPDLRKLAAFSRTIDGVGVSCTAPHQGPEDWDFVSRYFTPARGIDEDPVTGAAHCALTPYWSERLGKTSLVGRQISARGGTVWCEDRGERVGLTGRCADYLAGAISL